jgi:hypothetical protein
MRLRAIIIAKEVGGKRKFVTGGDWGSDFCRMWSSTIIIALNYIHIIQ